MKKLLISLMSCLFLINANASKTMPNGDVIGDDGAVIYHSGISILPNTSFLSGSSWCTKLPDGTYLGWGTISASLLQTSDITVELPCHFPNHGLFAQIGGELIATNYQGFSPLVWLGGITQDTVTFEGFSYGSAPYAMYGSFIVIGD